MKWRKGSDCVICLWDEGAARGAGTKGELTIARYFGKPVYLVTRSRSKRYRGGCWGVSLSGSVVLKS